MAQTEQYTCEHCGLKIEEEDICPECTCTCGKYLGGKTEDLGACRVCGFPVCDDCQAPFTIHSQIDFDLHEDCYQGE